jgi:hypothetical protein
MKVVMAGIAAAAMLAGMAAAPAMAQSSTAFENAAIGLATGCLNAEPTTNPDGVISACSKFVGDMGGLVTQLAPTVGPRHECRPDRPHDGDLARWPGLCPA